ncbi:hypothetical protein GCM10027073_49840 [Streptomyces chlorus]
MRRRTRAPGAAHRPDAFSGAARKAREGDRDGVGTAGIHFHRELVAPAGGDRMNELMRGVFAEPGLAFHGMGEFRRLHEPHMARNADTLRVLRSGEREQAGALPTGYLDDSLERRAQVHRRRLGRRNRVCDNRDSVTHLRRLGCCQTEDLVCAP